MDSKMAEGIRWIEGEAQVGIERICPAQHITQRQWKDEWNQGYGQNEYPFISDFECFFKHPVERPEDIDKKTWNDLQEARRNGIPLRIKNLAHFTNLGNACKIIESGGFKGGIKKFNEDNKGGHLSESFSYFSWWSPKFSDDDKELVRETLEEAMTPFLDDDDDDVEVLKNQFARSQAFDIELKHELSGYGDRYFQFDIAKLCEYYQKYIGEDEVQYRILGTFAYKVEIMHAILVCSKANGDEMFKDYPLVEPVDGNGEAVVTRDVDGNWTWRPQATATQIERLYAHRQKYPNYRRWEHVAFAFHIQETTDIMAVPDLIEHLHNIDGS